MSDAGSDFNLDGVNFDDAFMEVPMQMDPGIFQQAFQDVPASPRSNPDDAIDVGADIDIEDNAHA